MKTFQIVENGFAKGRIYKIKEDEKLVDKHVQGNNVKLLNIIGNTASVSFKNSKLLLPVEVLINIENHEINKRMKLNDCELIAVIGRNEFFPVGTILKAEVKVEGEETIIYSPHGKLSIATKNLVGLTIKAIKLNKDDVKKATELLQTKFGNESKKVVETINTKVIKEEQPKTISEFLQNLPQSIKDTLTGNIKSIDRVWYDYNNNSHDTIEECIRANESILIDIQLKEIVNICTLEINKRE